MDKKLLHSKMLSDTDVRVLQRLTFELHGYNTLIREFTTVDAEFNLDKEKWEELLNRRDCLIAIQQEVLSKICGPGYSGQYSIDFITGELSWG